MFDTNIHTIRLEVPAGMTPAEYVEAHRWPLCSWFSVERNDDVD